MEVGPRYRRWLEPSLPAMLWITLVLVLLSSGWRTALVTSDGDGVAWRRVGDWMIQHRQVMRTEVFSGTRAGTAVVAKEWLASVVLAAAGNAWGLYGLALVAAVLIASTFALLLRQLLREGHDPLTCLLLTCLAAAAASMHWLARPHLFSLLLVPVAHAALRQHRREKDAPWLGAVIVGVALLWANLHGGFLVLFVLLGAHWLEAAWERDKRRLGQLSLIGALAGAATLANPNMWELYTQTFGLLGSKFLTGWIAEFASPDFHGASARGFLLWLALMFVVLALVRPRLRVGDGVLLAAFTWFALYSRRHIPVLVLVSAPILAGPVSEWLCRHWTRWAAAAARVTGILAYRNGWLSVLTVAGLMVLWHRPIEFSADHWPVNAVQLVRFNPRLFQGQMFNQYAWGSYLLHELPDHAPFVDSRADVYGEELIREFDRVTRLQPGWQEILAKYRVRWTLMPSDHRLNAALAVTPGWKHKWQDDVATIYMRTTP